MAEIIGQPQNVQVPNYSGVNIQIFNPSVAAPGGVVPASNVNAQNYSTNPMAYPANYYTQNLAQSVQTQAKEEVPAKKTEKREIVQLTDNHIMMLEKYLNDQNKDVRLMGAKEVLKRFQEDSSRKDDPALNVLINKMLQDPSQPVRFIALAALDSRIATGNRETVKLLQQIQQQKSGYGQDALQASNILLRMSGNTVQKEFEVKNQPEKTKTEKKETKKE